MKTINCFVVWGKEAENIAIPLRKLLREKGFESEITLVKDYKKLTTIPEEKDIYFVHLHDLTKEQKIELEQLQEKQPESYFIRLGGEDGGLFKGKDRILSREYLVWMEDIDMVLSEYVKNVK